MVSLTESALPEDNEEGKCNDKGLQRPRSDSGAQGLNEETLDVVGLEYLNKEIQLEHLRTRVKCHFPK
jgi:hypothetical protein